MSIEQFQVVQIDTSPRQLREWADNLESRWNATQLGGELPAIWLYGPVGSGIRVRLTIDQDLIASDIKKAGPKGRER